MKTSNDGRWIKSESFWFYRDGSPKMLKMLLFALAVAVITVIGWCFIPSFGLNYSHGERSGILQKYSVKGVIWKTGEGELILPNFIMPSGENNTGGGFEKFEFSDMHGRDFNSMTGKKVKVFYSQAWHRVAWEGSTAYQVDSIVEVTQ